MRATNQELKTWKGNFGREYTERNAISPESVEDLYKENYGVTRTRLNGLFIGGMDRSARILEVGANIGNQLLLLEKMGFKNLYGIEPQDYAVKILKKSIKETNAVKGNVFNMPFEDGYFDIVFTSGVLIHINPRDIKKAMKEITRCARKYIWGFEYYSKNYEEIVYRGRKDLLWKADFAGLYAENFPDLKCVKIKLLKYLKSGNIDAMFLLEKP